jgi:hypothetical protein
MFCIQILKMKSMGWPYYIGTTEGGGISFSGGSRNKNLWGQPVGAMGPNHICCSKITLDSSKPVGPDGPTGYTYVRH